jgi:hypothetical protein
MAQPFGPNRGPNEPGRDHPADRGRALRSLSAIQAGAGPASPLGATRSAIVSQLSASPDHHASAASITITCAILPATGDLTREDRHPSGQGRWDDETAHMLATTFNTLTDSIGRFSAKARQRERLSSLGRLSTGDRAQKCAIR